MLRYFIQAYNECDSKWQGYNYEKENYMLLYVFLQKVQCQMAEMEFLQGCKFKTVKYLEQYCNHMHKILACLGPKEGTADEVEFAVHYLHVMLC